MVDCDRSSCLQERRLIKKELLNWQKKIPVLIGLEQVANLLVGPRKMKQLLGPTEDVLSSIDWTPETTCNFCEFKKEDDILDDANALCENGHDDDDDGVTSPMIRSCARRSLCYSAYNGISSRPAPGRSRQGDSPLSDEEPLDLSARGSYSEQNADDTGTKRNAETKLATSDAKSGKKSEYPGSVKRSYTADELTAAVSDIRSGKLGTRRAATLYGIPRSTLRNKIFRLENQRQSATKTAMGDVLQGMVPRGAPKAESPRETPPLPVVNPDEPWERRFEELRRKHDFKAGLDRPFGVPPLFYNACNMLQCEKAFRWSDPYSYEHKMPFLHTLIRKFTQERVTEHDASYHGYLASANVFRQPMGSRETSPERLRSPVELKIPSFKPTKPPHSTALQDKNAIAPLSIETESLQELNEAYSLDLPSGSRASKETMSGGVFSAITDHLPKDGPPFGYFSSSSSYFNTEVSYEDSSLRRHSPLDHAPTAKRQRSDVSDTRHRSLTEEKPSKKTRPKRGQYRKYNSQLLIEAVKAVQRGEMSVHRAGSYFGVPHSTLEYKVKERHLLRQKKQRGEQQRASQNDEASSSNTESLGVANNSSSDDSNAIPSTSSEGHSGSSSTRPLHPADFLPPTVDLPNSPAGFMSRVASSLSSSLPLGLAPPPFSWPQPLMNASNLPLPGTLPTDPSLTPFLPTGFAINTSASELLKKLQRKVEASADLANLMRHEDRTSRKRRRSEDIEQCQSS